MNPLTLEINLNPQLQENLAYYGIKTSIVSGFITTDLPDNASFRARAIYEDEYPVSSLLEVNCVTEKGENIYDHCRDSGTSIQEAVTQNFNNFSSTLNPLLAALGSLDPYSYENTSIEEWEINGKIWEAYIGKPHVKFVQKIIDFTLLEYDPPDEFIASLKTMICNLNPNNRLHWFRGYYCQQQREITIKEFLMDNQPVNELMNCFDTLPIISNMDFFSCRTFIVIKEKRSEPELH